jgi:hypothetical protein
LGTVDEITVKKLSAFAVPIGLLAGVTSEKVFERLIKYDVPLETASLDRARRERRK